jgi:aspartate/methionine/tyrosine aminotransferase
MRPRESEYLNWAKTRSLARYNLATSGVAGFPLRELQMDFSRLEINGENSYGYAPLQEAIGQHYGVDPDCVVQAQGTSMANHLVLAALLDPGDEVLIEHPVYGPIVDAARYLGAEVRHFPRTEESGYAVDPAAIRRGLTPRTRLIVLSNLHNPTSVLAPEAVLREVGGLGVTVLVDEVYLDAVYENTPRTAFLLGPNFVTTSSLTKVYGVSGLRCGWILAHPDLARRISLLNDVFGATPVHPAELLSVAAFEQLDVLRDRARRILEADRAALRGFGPAQPLLAEWGTTAFLRLEGHEPEEFFARLRAEHETSVVPGRFFGMPGHYRIGMGVHHENFVEGLRRLGEALTRSR